MATIMPVVAEDLGSRHLYGWVFSAFFLGSLLGIVAVGGAIDRGGLVGPFLTGLALFSVGLVVGGLTPSMEILVLGRLLQGLGAGAIPPIAYVAIGRRLPAEARPYMFATLSAAWIVPGLAGPAVSGIVAETVGWRVVFLGLLPLIVLAGAMTLPAITGATPGAAEPQARDGESTEPDPAPGAGGAHRDRLPWALAVTLGAALVLAGLTAGSFLPAVALVGAGLLVGLPAFHRLTPPGTLAARGGLPAAVLLRGLLTFAFFCADAYVPLALHDWRGLDAASSGVALTAATLAWTAGSWIQARWFTRLGARWFVTLGFVTVVAGILGFTAALSPLVPVPVAIGVWAVAGLGMGFSYSPLSLVVLAVAPVGEQGTATAGLQLSDVLGTALGTGVGGAIIAAAGAAGAAAWVGVAGAFAVGAAVGLVGIGLAARLPGPLPATSRAPAPATPAPPVGH